MSDSISDSASREPDGGAKQRDFDRAIRGGSGTLLGSLVGGGLAFLNAVLAARFLGATVYGLFGLGVVLANVGEALSTFGLRLTVIHFLPIQRSQNKHAEAAGTILAALLLPLVIGCSLATALWLSAPFISVQVFAKPGSEPFIRILAVAIPLISLSDILASITRGFGFARYYVIIRNLVQPLSYLFLILLLLGAGGEAIQIAYAFAASYVLALVAAILSVAKTAGPAVTRSTPVFNFRSIYSYAGPVFLNVIFYLVLSWTDILMLGYFSTAEDVGIYRACVQMVIVFDMIVIAFNAAIGHIYSVLEDQGKREELSRNYDMALRWVGMCSVLAFLVIGLNGSELLRLMGPDFAIGGTALVVLASGQLLKSCFGSAAFLLSLCGRQKVESANGAIAALVNVILNLILIPRFGIVGAAIATACSLLIVSILRVVQVRYYMGLSSLRPALLGIGVLGVCVGLVAYGGGTLIDAQESTRHFVPMLRILTTLFLFCVGLWRFILTPEEKALVSRTLGRREVEGT